ncbi:MAG: MutS-related protein family 1, partial [Myxococcaceae bacterium]|nr:MutS-related protein family 1 [Myxococcaceae bacterium]
TPTRARVAEIAASVSSKERALARYADMLAAIENEKLESELLKDRHGILLASGKSATREMAALGRILGFLDARNNEVFRIFIGPVLMWDLNCAIALEGWRLHAGKNVRAWLSALAEIEALSSLAGFAFDRPDHVYPELSSSPNVVATALAHPMIPAKKRIANDLELDGPGRALVITGSNMSGKSTLLRAVGTNAVLALAGAPACATKMSIGDVRVVTSMRVTDSLEEGVSHFYAELQKLKMVCDMARGERTVLFLLDEILHGTNTRERLIGARAIVRELVKRGAMGAVSTHDLAIGDLETELPGKVQNFHFEEQVVNDKMTFDYKLRTGVVQSSNALRLMKIVGLDIDVEV